MCSCKRSSAIFDTGASVHVMNSARNLKNFITNNSFKVYGVGGKRTKLTKCVVNDYYKFFYHSFMVSDLMMPCHLTIAWGGLGSWLFAGTEMVHWRCSSPKSFPKIG